MRRSFLSAIAITALVGSVQAGRAEEFGTRDLSIQQNSVASVQPAEPGTLKVMAWVDHHNNIYNLGESVRLSVKANKDAYFAVVSVGPSGNAVLLYPNAFQPGTEVKAGQVLEIPGKNAAAAIVATGEPGTELIRVVAATSPFDLVGPAELSGSEAFRTVEGGAGSLVRDLQLVRAAEAIYYDKIIKTVGAKTATTGHSTTDKPPASGQVASTSSPAMSTAAAPATGARLPLLLATDRLTYKPGDLVTMAVTALEPCHLWVVDVSSDGSAPRVLFPNQIMQDNRVEANQTVLVSGGSSSVKVLAAGGAGRDAVFALCGQDATPPWQGGVDFSVMFSPVDPSQGLGRALVLAGSGSPQTAVIPAQYTWAETTLTVGE